MLAAARLTEHRRPLLMFCFMWLLLRNMGSLRRVVLWIFSHLPFSGFLARQLQSVAQIVTQSSIGQLVF